MPTWLTCANWLPREHKEMARQGFARCAHGPTWAYHPTLDHCARHKPAEQAVQDARIKWDEKLSGAKK